MIKIGYPEVCGWDAAIVGMRNPMNSWAMSDSGRGSEYWEDEVEPSEHKYIFVDSDNGGDSDLWIGPNDQKLMESLRDAGTDHRKFMRMIVVYTDITAPLYWWKEFDTYKVGTVANSCSTMHKIAAKEFTLDDFSHEHLQGDSVAVLESVIHTLNVHREWFNNKVLDDPKIDWWQMIQLLPSSYNQKRTVMLNYEVLTNIYKSRRNHKLDEWRTFCEWIERLPYGALITGKKENGHES